MPIQNFSAYQRTAIDYWEKRRIIYNAVLIFPSAVAYIMVGGISAGVGDTQYHSLLDVMSAFVLHAIAANFCYSFVYVLEFIFGNESPDSNWQSLGRTWIFATGTIISVLLAFLCAGHIAAWEYSPPT